MKSEIVNAEDVINNLYVNIKELVVQSRTRVYKTINTEMVNLYWNIGKMIVEKQGGNNKAKYKDYVIEQLSIKLLSEFGKFFSKRNLERMRLFYTCYSIATTLSSQLSWSHYVELIKIKKENEKKNMKLI